MLFLSDGESLNYLLGECLVQEEQLDNANFPSALCEQLQIFW